MRALLQKLDGGDLRSIGRVDEVVQEVVADTSLSSELMAGLRMTNPLIRMRCADALEKVSRKVPHILRPHRAELRSMLLKPQPKEVLWHLLLIAPRLTWRSHDLPGIIAAATKALSDSSSIVKVCGLQALVNLLPQLPEYRPQVLSHIRNAIKSGTPAMRTRGKRLLHLLRLSPISGVEAIQ
jgi:hypothetical protein